MKPTSIKPEYIHIDRSKAKNTVTLRLSKCPDIVMTDRQAYLLSNFLSQAIHAPDGHQVHYDLNGAGAKLYGVNE